MRFRDWFTGTSVVCYLLPTIRIEPWPLTGTYEVALVWLYWSVGVEIKR